MLRSTIRATKLLFRVWLDVSLGGSSVFKTTSLSPSLITDLLINWVPRFDDMIGLLVLIIG